MTEQAEKRPNGRVYRRSADDFITQRVLDMTAGKAYGLSELSTRADFEARRAHPGQRFDGEKWIHEVPVRERAEWSFSEVNMKDFEQVDKG